MVPKCHDTRIDVTGRLSQPCLLYCFLLRCVLLYIFGGKSASGSLDTVIAMIDPFTALSLAGNVVQFVQLGCKLTAEAHDVYTSVSGASEENIEMETVTTRLTGTVQELDDHLEAVDRTTSFGSVSKSSKRLIEIANACRMIAADILSRLEAIKMRGPPSVWGSIRQAIKIMWTKEELDALIKRLKAYISELDTAILVSIK